jgi:SpoVK/Ycf46/Vps4 family AAA+-type ATPase
MARSDLLVTLVKASVAGDKRAARVATDAIIADERAKQHNVLADRLTRVMQSNGSNGAHAIALPTETGMRGREFVAEITPRRQLEELVLSDALRTVIGQFIDEQRRASLLRAHGLDPRHRILLVGPPGNGKTSLAEAIAESLAVPFFVVRYEAMIGSYLGETAGRLKRVFDYTRTTPCVLFFDEFDAVGKERGDVHETGEIKRVVTSLLMQVDDLPSYTIVIAATNHAELLDRAVWRRFQIRLALEQPSTKALARYFDAFLAKLTEPAGVTGAALAKRLGNLSYSEAEQFTLDVRRQLVLSLEQQRLKDVVASQARLWEVRVKPKKRVERGDDGETASAGAAKSK